MNCGIFSKPDGRFSLMDLMSLRRSSDSLSFSLEDEQRLHEHSKFQCSLREATRFSCSSSWKPSVKVSKLSRWPSHVPKWVAKKGTEHTRIGYLLSGFDIPQREEVEVQCIVVKAIEGASK